MRCCLLGTMNAFSPSIFPVGAETFSLDQYVDQQRKKRHTLLIPSGEIQSFFTLLLQRTYPHAHTGLMH